MDGGQATNVAGASNPGSGFGESFKKWIRSLEGYGPAFAIVVAVVAHLLVLNNSANARFDGLYREMNDRFDRLVDHIAVLEDKMERHFEKMEATADERRDRMRAEADRRYDRMGAEADVRYERSDQRADERFDRLLAVVRLHERRISSLETVFRSLPTE